MNLDQAFTEEFLFDSLAPFFGPQGFGLIQEKKQFRKATSYGFHSVIISVSSYEDLVMIEFHFGIRFDSIENLVSRFTRSLRAWKPDAHTLILSQGKLYDRKYWRFEAKSVDELEGIIESFEVIWREKAVSFFEDIQGTSDVHVLLNSHPKENSMYVPNQGHRCLRGIAAAHLSQSDQFPKLILAHRARLREIPNGSAFLEGYEKLVHYLKGINWN